MLKNSIVFMKEIYLIDFYELINMIAFDNYEYNCYIT